MLQLYSQLEHKVEYAEHVEAPEGTPTLRPALRLPTLNPDASPGFGRDGGEQRDELTHERIKKWSSPPSFMTKPSDEKLHRNARSTAHY